MLIDLKGLNSFEKNIYSILMQYMRENGELRITQAAEICGCSTSKISKFVKKLGFSTYKKFLEYVMGKESQQNEQQTELERIARFVDRFDVKSVDIFLRYISKYERIILMGYGPSSYCAEYMEYKLRFCTDKIVIAVSDEVSARVLLNRKTLLIIFSTTGKFASFKSLEQYAKIHDGEVLLVVEEYHPQLINEYENVLFLTDSMQDNKLKAHEKSRVITFIFIEEIIFRMLRQEE